MKGDICLLNDSQLWKSVFSKKDDVKKGSMTALSK